MFGMIPCVWKVIFPQLESSLSSAKKVNSLFFWPCLRHMEVPGLGIDPASQQWPEPLQWQRWIFNMLATGNSKMYCFLIVAIILGLFWYWLFKTTILVCFALFSRVYLLLHHTHTHTPTPPTHTHTHIYMFNCFIGGNNFKLRVRKKRNSTYISIYSFHRFAS